MFIVRRMISVLAATAVTLGAYGQGTLEEGIKMFNYKKYKTAQGILSPLAASNPQANYYLGLMYLEAGDMATASSTFSKYPEDPANISGTARVAFANKDVARGMQIAKDLAAKGKKKDWIQEKYAADAISGSTGGDNQQAVAWYTDALTKNKDPQIYISLGDTYRKIPGGGGQAMDNYESVTSKDPKNSLALSRIGDLWYDARNYQSALDNYNKAKDADATNPLPYMSLANAYARSGRYQQALENIKKYIELSDKTIEDRLEYVRALFRAQSSCDAAKYAQEMLNKDQLSPDNRIELMGILGYSEANCGDSVKALTHLRQYFSIQDPKKILSGDYVELGKLFLKLDMLDSAGYYYSKGVADDTSRNKSDLYRQVAEAFKAKKEYCKSGEWFDNLIKANPTTQPLDYFWRGYMFYYCNQLTKAVVAFDDYEKKYPNEPSSIYWHARALAAIDSEAKDCSASETFVRWLDKVGPNYEKKNDMKIAYEYLILCAYNKKDKETMKQYIDKVKVIDPNDRMVQQIEAAEKSSGAPPKKK